MIVSSNIPPDPPRRAYLRRMLSAIRRRKAARQAGYRLASADSHHTASGPPLGGRNRGNGIADIVRHAGPADTYWRQRRRFCFTPDLPPAFPFLDARFSG